MSIIDTYDFNKTARLNPTDVIKPIEGFPEAVILTYSKKIINNFQKAEGVVKIADLDGIPIYRLSYNGKGIAFCLSPYGASAAAITIEELIAMGAKHFVVFGSCGVLDRSIGSGQIIVPTAAYRDEGTSYHYLPAKDYIVLRKADKLASILSKLKVKYVMGKTWTTDAIYRETDDKFEKRKKEGCICVEMEASALAAVCEFREVDLYQFFYAADNLDSEAWDQRILGKLTDYRRNRYMKIAIAAAEIIMSIQ